MFRIASIAASFASLAVANFAVILEIALLRLDPITMSGTVLLPSVSKGNSSVPFRPTPSPVD
jgi:hypothetical protein